MIKKIVAGIMSVWLVFATVAGPVAGTVAQANAAQTITTSAIDTTGASLITLCVANSSGVDPTTMTVSDSMSNTWDHGTAHGSTSPQPYVTIFYLYRSAGGGLLTSATHTFTLTEPGGTGIPSVSVATWTGTLTGSDPLGAAQNGGFIDDNSPPYQLNTGNITPAADGHLVLSCGAFRTLTNYTTTLTLDNRADSAVGAKVGIIDGYQIQTTATLVSDTLVGTASGPGQISVAIASFKPASASTVIRRRFVW